MAAKKSAASTAWKIVLGFLVGLLVLVLIVELGLRWYLSSQMTKASPAGAEPEVSFGATPLVLGLARGELTQMEMHIPSTLRIEGQEATGQPASDVRLEGVGLGQNPTARHLVASSTIPDDFLLVTLQKGIAEQSGYDMLGNVVITDIVANQAADTVDVEFGGGLFTLTLDPKTVDGQLQFTATSSKLLAWELPQEATSAISDALQQGMADQFGGGDLEFADVEVLDGEVKFTLEGQDVPLNELNSQFGGLGQGVEHATS